MANLSKERRDRMMSKLEELKLIHSDDESIMAFNEIENALKEKKFGLVFEEHSEAVDDMLIENIPVFAADPERRICKDADLPWNHIIEGDNLQALYLLDKTHRGRIDCIYIDPPYNTGARDWKYNNDYVDGNDQYRHSKWLSMMQKRLVIAKRLLKPDGVLICAIDDNELNSLGLLLAELFPEKKITPVAIVHNPSGTQGNNLSYNNEFLYFLYNPSIVSIYPEERSDEEADIRPFMNGAKGKSLNYLRGSGATTFYPIIVKDGAIIGFGDVSPDTYHPEGRVVQQDDCYYVYPIDNEKVERKWLFGRDTVPSIQSELFVKNDRNGLPVIYRKKNRINRKTVWISPEYSAKQYGSILIKNIINRDFSFPKSLYAVKEAVKSCVEYNKDAIILDFFAGSGTTMHAVNLLNAEDGGHRRCIMITNNEVSDEEAKKMTAKGLKKGDPEWESLGIAKYVTWPRTICTIEGHNVSGEPLSGSYLGSGIPMANGFKANVKYYKCEWISKHASESTLSDQLFEHIKEMVELENAVEVDGHNYVIVLSEEDADSLEQNWDNHRDLKGVYLSRNVLLTTRQNELFYTKPVHIIPDYYFNIEMREVGETW